MTLGLLVMCVVLAVAAGLFVGSVAARQLEPGPDERRGLGVRARRAATRGAMRWLFRRRRGDQE